MQWLVLNGSGAKCRSSSRGGTGFIGSELVRQLVAAGHDVTGLARTPENARRLEGMGASAIVGDVRTPPGASGRREGRGRGRAPRASEGR